MNMTQPYCRFAVTFFLIITLITCVNAQSESYEPNDSMDWSLPLSGMGGQFSGMLAYASSAQMGLPSPQSDDGQTLHPPRSRPTPQSSNIPDNDCLMVIHPGQIQGMLSQSAPAQFIVSPMFASTEHLPDFGGQFCTASNEIPIPYGNKGQHLMDEPHIFQPSLSQMGPTSYPRNYLEASHSPSAASIDDGPFPMDMPSQDFPTQQHYPDLHQYDVEEYPWAHGEPQQPAMMQTQTADVPVMTGSYTSPGTDLPHTLPEDPNNFYDDATPAMMDMQGWINRAPPFGDHLLPRLDTNHLAPPASSIARSPSSASSVASSSSRLSSSRRNRAHTMNGEFACYWCTAAFSTSLDLTHHLRSHAPYASRNHVCQQCEKRFQYRKDLLRHLPRHDPNREKFYCPFTGCKYHNKGFGRRDHLERHVSSQHGRFDISSASSPA